MSMCVRRLYVVLGLAALSVVAMPTAAMAQYRPQESSGGAVGEVYHIEASYGWWNPQPELIVNSEALGILGTDVNLVDDLGIQKKRLGKFDLVLRPAKKHRFRFQHLPIGYQADSTVQRSFVFNGQRYNVGLPVRTDANFQTYRFGYEFDFLQFKRGWVGAMIDMKYTNIDVSLLSPIGEEFTTAAAPIPTFGFVGRGYPLRNLAVTGEMSFFRVPDSIGAQVGGDGSYTDWDINATYNINRYVGAQLGFRSVHVAYNVDTDNGSLKFQGLYFGGVVRY
jgi:hypothetical protein